MRSLSVVLAAASLKCASAFTYKTVIDRPDTTHVVHKGAPWLYNTAMWHHPEAAPTLGSTHGHTQYVTQQHSRNHGSDIISMCERDCERAAPDGEMKMACKRACWNQPGDMPSHVTPSPTPVWHAPHAPKVDHELAEPTMTLTTAGNTLSVFVTSPKPIDGFRFYLKSKAGKYDQAIAAPVDNATSGVAGDIGYHMATADQNGEVIGFAPMATGATIPASTEAQMLLRVTSNSMDWFSFSHMVCIDNATVTLLGNTTLVKGGCFPVSPPAPAPTPAPTPPYEMLTVTLKLTGVRLQNFGIEDKNDLRAMVASSAGVDLGQVYIAGTRVAENCADSCQGGFFVAVAIRCFTPALMNSIAEQIFTHGHNVAAQCDDIDTFVGLGSEVTDYKAVHTLKVPSDTWAPMIHLHGGWVNLHDEKDHEYVPGIQPEHHNLFNIKLQQVRLFS
jgi:hypothetical protein